MKYRYPTMNVSFGNKSGKSPRRKFFLVVIALLAVLISVGACTTSNLPWVSSTPTPVPTATIVPTETPVPPTATPAMSPFCPIVGTDYWDRLGFDFRLVQTDKGGQNIQLVTKGKNDVMLTSNPLDYESHPRLSPDNNTIVFARKTLLPNNRSTDQNIWVMSSHGNGQQQLTSMPGWDDSYPFFSADGSQIYFVRNPVGTPEYADLYVMHADGSAVQRLTLYKAVWEPLLTSDGQHIAFHSGPNNAKFVMNLDGSNLQDITGNCP